MNRRFSFLLLSLLLLGACVPKKRLTYLQEETQAGRSDYQLQRSLYKVQPNDILSITVRSYDMETAQLFNIANVGQQQMLQAGDIMFYLQGYSIDLNGNIQMPILGEIKVNNKSILEIQTIIEEKLANYFTEEAVNVTVQLAGIRYAVVGEVARPGKYVIYQNQVNIFEALAQAGDMTMVGDRKAVMVVRQGLDNKVESFYLDLTDASVISDPRYFIQPNDIINVMPLAQKSFGIGTTGFQTFSQLLSVLASTITLIIAINSLNN